jgi:excisionase family DNA binding protein
LLGGHYVPIQQARLSSHPVTPQPTTLLTPLVPRLLTIKQAAVYLGSAVWAVREAIWAKDLKACKIGRRFVIPREELDAYIDRKIEERAVVSRSGAFPRCPQRQRI